MIRTLTLAILFGPGLVLPLPAMAAGTLATYVEMCSNPKTKPDEAMRFCRKAIETGDLSPVNTGQVWTNYGMAAMDANRLQEALKAFDSALDAAPGLVIAYLGRARAFEALNQPQDALADYNDVLQIDPQAADAYLGRGTLLLKLGQNQEAVDDFSQAIQFAPNWVSPYFNRGLGYLALDRPQDAVADFDRVISTNDADAGAYLNRGRARAAMDDTNAQGDFDKAIELRPEWANAWFARGQYFDQRGDKEAANRDFIRAYDLGYKDPWLINRIRNVSQ